MIDVGLADRFKSKVRVGEPDKCWLWTASTDSSGYGKIRSTGSRSWVGAHRVALAIHEELDSLPDTRVMCCHRCDNRLCVNPHHLYWGDHSSNMDDMVDRGRWSNGTQTGETHHLAILSDAQVVEIRSLLSQRVRQVDIAHRFGVTQSSISAINTGKNRITA